MRFECDSCHARYKISEEKVRGRVVRFPCRKCDHKILIDGRQNDADVTVPAGAAYNFQEVTRRSEPASRFSAHEAATARARRPSSPPRRRAPSVPPRRPSAASRRVSSVPAVASGALMGQHPGLAPPVPAALSTDPFAETQVSLQELPEWHVSVNDVPIGPIRLEEMAHKIDAGAVSEYSLVWRDGFDEWRPLATVPTLMSLLHERRHSGLPARSSFSSMPPFVDTRTSIDDSVPAALQASSLGRASAPSRVSESAPLAVPPFAFPDPDKQAVLDDEIESIADSLQPELGSGIGLDELSQPPAPIGPEGIFDSSPQLGSYPDSYSGAYSGLPPTLDSEVSVPPVPPEPAAATAEPKSRLSLGVLMLIVAVAVFSGVAAFLAFERFGDELLQQWVDATESIAPGKRPIVKPVPAPSAAPEETVEAEPPMESEGAVVEAEARDDGAAGVDEAEPADDADLADDAEVTGSKADAIVPPPDPRDDSPKIAPAPRPRPRARRQPSPKPAPSVAPEPEPEREVRTDDEKLLEEFQSDANAAPAKIDVEESGSPQRKKPGLDGDDVRATVTANKGRLQRCYERAIRGQQAPPSVRLDVSVMVASSGRVKSVTSEGSGPGGLAACVEASVRRWRFPESAEGGPARFPIVFSAN